MRQDTIDNLKALSAKVVKMDSPQSTKIEALKEAIHYIEKGDIKYDNVVILDADNIVKTKLSRENKRCPLCGLFRIANTQSR